MAARVSPADVEPGSRRAYRTGQVADGYGAQMKPRRCSRSGCSLPAVATLTYAYADMTAVLGPLSPAAEPHNYDLCTTHAQRLVAPRGWAVVRLEGDPSPHIPTGNDLEALADAVREAARPAVTPPVPGELGRRGHLRALPSPS